MDQDKMLDGIRTFLDGLDERFPGDDLENTARRVARAWVEDLVGGYATSAADLLTWTPVPDGAVSGWAMRTISAEVTAPIRYAGLDSDDPLTFKVYDPDRMVLGKRMEDHLRMAVCYWHSFNWPGSDVFGAGTFYLLRMMNKRPATPKLGLRDGPIRTAGITPAPQVDPDFIPGE